MWLKTKILKFFQALRKAPRREPQFKTGADPALFPPDPMGKRPAGFFMPEWAKKDNFENKDMGQMVPPEELADAGSFRRPGDWLVKQLTGRDDAQQFENIKKSNQSSREVGMSDQEIDDFLGDFLSAKERKRRRSKGPKKPSSK